MLTGIREKAIINEHEKVEISAPDLPVGTEVEVMVWVEEEMDETEYLLSTKANRAHLERALEDLKHPERYIYINLEDYEKDSNSPGSL